MEYMSLIGFVQYGTPLVLLGLIAINIYQAGVIKQLQDEVRSLKSSITWGAQCNERHAHIDTRLDKLETRVFTHNG